MCESDTSSQAPDLPILDSESNSVDDTSNEVLDVESEPEPEQENHDSSNNHIKLCYYQVFPSFSCVTFGGRGGDYFAGEQILFDKA